MWNVFSQILKNEFVNKYCKVGEYFVLCLLCVLCCLKKALPNDLEGKKSRYVNEKLRKYLDRHGRNELKNNLKKELEAKETCFCRHFTPPGAYLPIPAFVPHPPASSRCNSQRINWEKKKDCGPF